MLIEKIFKVALAIFSSFLLIIAFFAITPFVYNLSGSAPVGVWKVTGDSLSKGKWGLACLPQVAAELAMTRGYVGHGNCPEGTTPVLKKVVAAFGDQVQVSWTGVLINGDRLPDSAPRMTDSRNLPLQRSQFHGHLRANQVWLHSPGNSYDSRYFGPIARQSVQRVHPVLVTERASAF